MTKHLQSALFLISILVFAGACTSKQSDQTDTPELEKAPNFEVITISGDTVSLQKSMAENKPTVVYFTASWCPICAQNWPSLSEVYPEYKEQLNLVAIGIDPTDDEQVMRELSEEKGFTFPLTKGLPNVMLDFDVESQATTVGVDRDGNIAFRKNKMVLSADEYRALFDELLN